MKITNKIIKTKESFDNLIEGLKINEENFKIQYSSSKLVVINENLKYTYYPNKLNNIKGLHFIKKVKDYILKNEIKYTIKCS